MLLSALLLLSQASVPLAREPTRPDPDPVRLTFALNAAFFDRYDIDKDGALSLAEFQSAMDQQLDKAIAAYPDRKDKITAADRASFRDGMAIRFGTFDRNADGKLTLAELKGGN